MNVREISEAEANETIQAIYDDIKATLCVSYVPAPFRALAAHEAFFQQMWRSVKPTLTIYAVRAADDLRASAVESAQTLDGRSALSGGERNDLIEALWVVHFVAPKTLLIAASVEEALSTGTTGAASRVVWPQNKGVPRGMPQPSFVHPPEASGTVGTIYSEIQETLSLPVLTDEWRALGISSDELQNAWRAVRDLSGGEAYSQAVEELTSAARERGRRLPRRVLDLDPETLRARGVDDDAQGAIRETVSALVPASAHEAIHTALWLRQLGPPSEAKRTGLQLLRRWSVPHGYRTDTVLA